MEIVGFLGQGEGGSVGQEGQQLLEKIVRWRWLIGVLHGFSLLSTTEREFNNYVNISAEKNAEVFASFWS